ncbi:YfbU family protein [Pseudomonas syringae]|uniref:YfbU family protein n=1 Tax=Pseudomonas syringae TaxID=317 RepID=UPI000E322CBE|nr:YfbU family protein [Pseudomonas syringae]
MDFSNEQKLIIALLTDIHSKLEIKDGLDPAFVNDKVQSGHTWALRWQYPGVFSEGYETPSKVRFVVRVLDLWERIEFSVKDLSSDQRTQLAAIAPLHGDNPKFSGFDGNGGDRDGYSVAHILIEEMGRWGMFKGRDLNSHTQMSEVYDRMLNALDRLNKDSSDFSFSLEELGALLNAKTHPDNR